MKGRVLIADDDSRLLACYAALLQCEDFEVQTAVSAVSAIAALESTEFDLVITDMAMETETAGYDVACAAQRQSHRPEVIVFTSFDIPSAEWKTHGVKELLTKGQTTMAAVSAAINRVFDESVCRRSPLQAGADQGCKTAAYYS